MIRITDDDSATTSFESQGDLCQSLLVRPGKYLCVVLDETVVPLRDRVRRVKINKIVLFGTTDCLFKISVKKNRSSQAVAHLLEHCLIAGIDMRLVSVRDVELPFEILSVDPVKGKGAEIDQTRRVTGV